MIVTWHWRLERWCERHRDTIAAAADLAALLVIVVLARASFGVLIGFLAGLAV